MTMISEFVLNFLLNALWQIVAITVVASLGAYLLKHGPARYRHTLWVAALGLSVGLPVWSVLGVAQKSGPTIMPQAGFTKTHDTAPGFSPAGMERPTTSDQKNDSFSVGSLLAKRRRAVETTSKIKDVMLEFLKGMPVSTTRITLPPMKFVPLALPK